MNRKQTVFWLNLRRLQSDKSLDRQLVQRS